MKRYMKYLQYIRLIVIIALIAGAVSFLSDLGKVKVDVSDYIGVEFSGLNEKGIAKITFDEEAFESAVTSRWKDRDRTNKKMDALTALRYSLSFRLDKTEGLKNGEKVTVTVTYNDKRAKNADCKLTGTSKTFLVEGLRDPVPVDPFDPAVFNTNDGIRFAYEGVAPQASLSLRNNCLEDVPQHMVSYRVDRDRDLQNGDVLTITAELSWSAQEEGYFLTQTETAFTVSGLDTYVSDVSQLKAEDVAKLQETAAKMLQKKFEDWRIGLVLSSTTCNGNSDSYGLQGKWENCNSLRFSGTGYMATNVSFEAGHVLLMPFYVDMTHLGDRGWDGERTDEETYRDFYNCAGFFKFYDLVVDANGNLASDTYEAYHGFAGSGSYDYIYEDADGILEQMKLHYIDNHLTEGTFAK